MLDARISYLENRDEIDEDAYQCKYCTDLCFLSMLSCTVCAKSEDDENEMQSDAGKEVVEKEVN